ncbi:MAG: hypothetical protein J0M26_02165 [Planctomycetes bacterium]|nr:hypothetical protein [Planctomycetota bacterium]
MPSLRRIASTTDCGLDDVTGQQIANNKECTRVADRAFTDGKSQGRNRVILVVLSLIS